MELDRGTLARLDRRLLAGLDRGRSGFKWCACR
jgi:hypothetical protein